MMPLKEQTTENKVEKKEDSGALKTEEILSLLSKTRQDFIKDQEILEKIWGFDVYPSSRTIDNFILTFRKIFEKDVKPSTYFKSIRGVGYKFTPD